MEVRKAGEELRPYPLDPFQDRVVRKIVFAKRKVLPRLVFFFFGIFIYPLKLLSRYRHRRSFIESTDEIASRDIAPIYVSSPTETMDSKFFYVVRQGKIWFKPIAAHPDAVWKLFGGQGFLDHFRTPLTSISADGDNLLAVDVNDIIHYAKSNQVICEVSFDCPTWRIVESRVDWTEKWFNMDGVSLLVNIFKDPILKSLKNNRSICMSHKGHETMFYTDMKGKKHPDPYVGVTTIYTLNDDGTRIFFADPWLQNKFGNELTTPEDGQFVAETLAASGSTLFVIQRAKDSSGREMNRMYTRFADFDSIGSNPALTSTYNIDNDVPLVRFLPPEDWIEQSSIDLQGKARLTKHIAIAQIGWGQNNRQLRVKGTNEDGLMGFYSKNIYELTWEFQPTFDVPADEEEFLSEDVPHRGFQRGPQICFDYEGGQLTPTKWEKNIEKISLEKFSHRGLNERGLHTKLVIIFADSIPLIIPLYARRGWRSLIGLSHANLWKLVIPRHYFQHEHLHLRQFLEQIFRNRSRHNVTVEENERIISISNVFFSRDRFLFTFQRKSQ